ncbi:phosphotransferase [Alteromonas sp. a30]|uniref:phosphotransferase n=1 Tax=Alteromonas sp. a30 TaxID=2730917 RepID=UPI002281D53F|nr:phosphotransferase [Alteromonas sp. a30]MCY7294455.1 phosphotransferase [Alteromonas sp. a30]
MLPSFAQWLDESSFRWLEKALGVAPESIQIVTGGKNNRGLQVVANGRPYFVKQYFDDDCHRFHRETAFTKLLQKHQVGAVAQLIDCRGASELGGEESEIAIFSHLSGQLPNEICISAKQDVYIQQVANFIASVNQDVVSQDASHLLPARGGLSLAAEFIREIQRRMQSLFSLEVENVSDLETPLYESMREWLKTVFEPAFRRVEKQVMHDFGDDLHAPFERVLSPSDIGFHNTLLDSETDTLSFFDFEYSGWDSAEKLVTDFFAQPRFELHAHWIASFCEIAFPKQPNLVERCTSLLPLSHLKWALIFLNEFKHPDDERRLFASKHQEERNNAFKRKQQQLDKARHRVARAE